MIRYDTEYSHGILIWCDTIPNVIIVIPFPFPRKLKSVHSAITKINTTTVTVGYCLKTGIMSTFLGLMLLLPATTTCWWSCDTAVSLTHIPGILETCSIHFLFLEKIVKWLRLVLSVLILAGMGDHALGTWPYQGVAMTKLVMVNWFLPLMGTGSNATIC